MKVEIPKNCPSCDSTLERVKDQLFCRNPNCGAKQAKQVINFAKVMKIKGLGERTVEKLGLQTINDIYDLTVEDAVDALGQKLAIKLMDEIEKSIKTPLSKFLAACSIPLVGITAAKKIATLVNIPNDITYEVCKEAGLGDKVSENLVKWVDTVWLDNLDEIPVFFIGEDWVANTDSSITVCITGKIPGYTKSKLSEYLASFGINTVDSVSKKITYLICNEQRNSLKERKAIDLGIKILTLEELIKEIK